MTRKSLIQREKRRQILEEKFHFIRRSSKKEISKVPSLLINGKYVESYNPCHVIVLLHVDVVFRPKDRELTTATLVYPDTYFMKWFTHVFYHGQQDQVGKD